ncbi:MAG: D-alanyl-D-alanine carboxypeptidase/D-alanyl-D-alanine-endopeptidase, partial [Longimicrobiales bacterium]|nr:D-alanyl-D-alanine carboxypeptidase/D-alanyl-D-alanine-endopeptidase [Longimicrobiales bacterium]
MVTRNSRVLFLSVLLAVAFAVLPETPGMAGAEAEAREAWEPKAVGPSDAVHPEIQQLRRELEGILTSAGNRRGRWAVLAVSLDRHDTLLAMNPDQLMVPASNMKLLSTAAALFYLGPDFRYRTFLLADGSTVGEVLQGDLVLYGTGDPTLSERFFPSETAALDTLASRILDSGIQEIHGNLVVDGSFFQGPDLHPEWDPADLNDAFAPPISAISLAENLVTVRVEAGSWVGAQPSIHTIPEGSGIPTHNVARTVSPSSRSRILLLRENPLDPIGIEGEMPLGGAEVWRRLPVPDPLQFTGLQLKRALEARGLNISGTVVTIRDPAASSLSPDPTQTEMMGGAQPRVLAVLDSPPLIDLLRVINKESNNFFAETVLKTLGRVVLGDGSFSGGGRVVESFLIEKVGVPPEELQVRDGSGLSVGNHASAGVFVRTLEYMSTSPFREQYFNTLPQAGTRR